MSGEGGAELREALMRWLSGRVGGMCWEEASWQEWGDEAGEILALPEVAALLANAERVQRVRELVAFYDRHEYSSLNVDDLRGALDGDAS